MTKEQLAETIQTHFFFTNRYGVMEELPENTDDFYSDTSDDDEENADADADVDQQQNNNGDNIDVEMAT